MADTWQPRIRHHTWQSIETAPRDGTWIIFHSGGVVGEGGWHDTGMWGWASTGPNMWLHPTEWMDLPDPPRANP